MRKSVFVIAVAAAACSSVAFAGEAKKDKAQAVKATTMSDAQMEKVTAGAGNAYAFGQNAGPGWWTNNGLGPNAHGKAIGHLQ